MQTSVRRQAIGIWKCNGCKVTFTGGAYELTTTVATTAKITMNRLKKLNQQQQEVVPVVAEKEAKATKKSEKTKGAKEGDKERPKKQTTKQ